MNDEKCPRCGHASSPSNIGHPCEVVHWNCGTYREPSGNIYESELCETRQEKRIASEQLEALSEDFAEMQAAKEKAEADLAKRAETAEAIIAEMRRPKVRPSNTNPIF